MVMEHDPSGNSDNGRLFAMHSHAAATGAVSLLSLASGVVEEAGN